MSTAGHQDRATSHRWQRNCADDLVAGHGVIVAEYFDVGCSRRLAWTRRPQAGVLLDRLADPDRRFDAIVVGEYERAFAGDQLLQLLPLFERHGVRMWLPETAGPVDRHDPAHQALIMLLGAQSRREVQRSRFRVTAAMRTQTREQGRYLGGRPPYGYRLADDGPHPNAAHARWGRRLRRLEPDPTTTPHVRWIFAQRLTGRSVANIARTLNDNGTPCPSGADPHRNRHRTGDRWTARTVATILENPRYTGRQVWNRQYTDHTSTGRGQEAKLRRNPAQDWIISTRTAHTALISEQDFIAVQNIRASRPSGDGSVRTYLLSGLLRCASCDRRMDSHWIHGRPGYRCRHGHTSAQTPAAGSPKILYLREDTILAHLATQPNLAYITQSPHRLAEHLRSNAMIIRCDRTNCTVIQSNRNTMRS